jgi:hypothetical protein
MALVARGAGGRSRAHCGALARAPSFIPVYWHQHNYSASSSCSNMRRAGVKLGFLISPSVDGEFGAMIVRRLGGEVIRGSSSHTGARALRDYYQALAHDGVSRRRSRRMVRAGRRGSSNRGRSARADVAAAHHPHGVRRLARLEDQMGPLRHPEALSRIVIVVGEPVYVAQGPGRRRDSAGCRRRWSETCGRLYAGKRALG